MSQSLQTENRSDVSNYLTTHTVNLRTPKGDVERVLSATQELGGGFALIVVDTLSRTLGGGDENSTVDMPAYVERIDEIRRETGAHVLVIHHAGKDLSRGARGNSSLVAATDTEVEMRPGVLRETKQREREIGPGMTFAIRTCPIGTNPDGEIINSATVTVNRSSKKVQQSPTDTERLVMHALQSCIEQNEAGSNFSAAEVSEELRDSGHPTSPDSVRQHLKSLTKKGLATSEKRGRWALRTVCPGNSSSEETRTETREIGRAKTGVENSRTPEIFG